MKRFPELNRIIISVMNDDVQVQAIMISNVKNLTKLTYDHSCYFRIFNNFENYISYIIKYSLANVESSTYLKTMNIKKTSLILSIDQKNQEVSKFSKKNNQLLSKLVTAKKVIRKLSREIYSNPIENGIDFINCINCKNNRRNIIFLPCGDLILCKDCLTLTMKCQANVSIKSEKLKCLKCNERVTQAKEVFY